MKSVTLAATLLLSLLPLSEASAQQLETFARFSRALGQEISIVDQNGLIREGVLEAATDERIVLRFGSVSQTFVRTDIATAERLKDSPKDGAVKGAVFGLVIGGLTTMIGGKVYVPGYVSVVGIYSGIGFLFDVLNRGREPLYRAPVSATPQPALKYSLRF